MAYPKYKKWVDSFAQDIRSGHLPAGTRLPPHRQFASQHGLALVTATRIYKELENMGLITGEVGRGTFVRETALPANLGIDQVATATGMIDLNFNYPSLKGQSELLRKALRQLALSGNLEVLLCYQPHGGNLHERAIIADYLKQYHLNLTASHVLIVNGAQHGLAVSVLGLLQPGDVLAVDALTYPGIKVVAKLQGIELCSIPVVNHQPDLNALETLCKNRRVKGIYTMPVLHNPLGWVTSLDWRQQLIQIARQHGLFIIEDAAYAFLAEDKTPPLAALAPDITVYVSGFSKNIATGLRVGFIATPPKWLKQFERVIRATAWNTPGVMSALVCGWLKDGTIKQLEQQKRQDAQARQHIVSDILHGFECIRHPSSYFLWLPLGEEVRADHIAMALMKENVSVSTAEPFSVTSSTPHAIRLALGSVELDVLRDGLHKVKRVIDYYSY